MANSRICSVDGCGKKHKGRGFCDKHLQRFRKHGSEHVNLTKKYEAITFFKEVVVPYEGDECLIWPHSKNDDGYGIVRWNGKTSLVCRILCEITTNQPGDGYESAHSCGNGMQGCVNKKHLSWKTSAENTADKFTHGTVLRGEDNPPAKLTNEQALEIFSHPKTISASKLASQYGVSKTTIFNIRAGLRWGWLTDAKCQSPITAA